MFKKLDDISKTKKKKTEEQKQRPPCTMGAGGSTANKAGKLLETMGKK